MYRVSCKQCHASVISGDIGAGSGDVLACQCCTQNHSHGEAANACPGVGHRHDGAPCPEPDDGTACTQRTEAGEPCPGEHCGLGVEDCTVCRPVELQWVDLTPIGA